MEQSVNMNQEVHNILFSKENDPDRRSKLTGETLGSIVLDSGCTASVCGEIWLSSYLDTLNEQEKLLIKKDNSETMFKFGDSEAIKSKGKLLFPVYLPIKKFISNVT